MRNLTGKNALANFVGGLSGPLLAIIMTPFYLRKLGLDGLGIVGLTSLLTTVLGIFVAGASKTYQRDLASAQETKRQDLVGIVTGGMIIFGTIAAILAIGILALGLNQSDNISHTTHFSKSSLVRCISFVSIILGAGVITNLFSSTLISLRDQVFPNTLHLIISILIAISAYFALSFRPSIEVFYLCQMGGALAFATAHSIRVWFVLRRHVAGITQAPVRGIWRRYMKGSSRLSLILILHEGLGVLITQIDRVLVTSFFPVSSLGAYNLGANPSRLTAIFSGPIASVTFPEFCRLAESRAPGVAIGEYLGRVTFVLTLLLCSCIILLVPSGGDILDLWLGAQLVPPSAAACFVILSIGSLLHSIAAPAYSLTVAFGRVGYGIPKNVVSLALLPLVGFLSLKVWGLPGVALVGVAYALISISVCGFFAFRRHCEFSGAKRWVFASLCMIALSGLIAFGINCMELDGMRSILLGVFTSSVFLVCAAAWYFGPRPSDWFRALEVIENPIPNVAPSA